MAGLAHRFEPTERVRLWEERCPCGRPIWLTALSKSRTDDVSIPSAAGGTRAVHAAGHRTPGRRRDRVHPRPGDRPDRQVRRPGRLGTRLLVRLLRAVPTSARTSTAGAADVHLHV